MDPDKTFIMVKPDGVQRSLIGETMKRFEQRGLKLLAAKLMIPRRETVEMHYAEHKGKPFFEELVAFIAQGPVFCTVWGGANAVKIGRAILGATSPLDSLPGTIRGDFGLTTGKNLVHASSCPEDASREIALWFSQDEIICWDRTLDQWIS